MGVTQVIKFENAPFEIIDGDRGKNYPKQHELLNKGYCLFLSAKNVTNDGFNFTECQFISKEKDNALRKGKIQPDDVVLTTRGTVGNVAFYSSRIPFDNIRINSGMVILRPEKSSIVPSYLYYFLKSTIFHQQVNSFRSGVAQPQLPISDMKHMKIFIPPLKNQDTIAAILSTYDDLIENNLRRIKILEEMAQNLYREWFVNYRFPGHEQTRFVDSPLGRIPEGWKTAKATDAVYVNPRTSVFKDSIKPYLAMNGLSADSMLISNVEKRSGNSGSKYKNGDTLFARITPCLEHGKTGFVSFLPNDESVGLGSTEFIVLRSKTLCPEYVYFLARSEDFRGNAINSMTGASGRQRVQYSCFDNYYLTHPDSETLQHFAEIIRPYFRQINLLADKSHNLRQTRDLLLPKLISGEVDVSELDINVPEEEAV